MFTASFQIRLCRYGLFTPQRYKKLLLNSRYGQLSIVEKMKKMAKNDQLVKNDQLGHKNE